MVALASPLRPVEDERILLIGCLDALDATTVAVERADLALAISVVAARYENALTDGFYPQIVESLGTVSAVEHAEGLLATARSAIATVRADMRGVEPINAHMSDAEGLEADIESLSASLRSLLEYEDAEVFKLVDLLEPSQAAALRSRMDEASAHQTSLPEPPSNRVLRKLAEVGEQITLAIHDRSTTWHPGIDGVLDGSE